MQAAPVASETAPPAPTLSHLGWEPVAGRGQRCERPAGLGWETEILITPHTASLFPGAFLDSACSHKARALQAGWSPLQVHQAGPQRGFPCCAGRGACAHVCPHSASPGRCSPPKHDATHCEPSRASKRKWLIERMPGKRKQIRGCCLGWEGFSDFRKNRTDGDFFSARRTSYPEHHQLSCSSKCLLDTFLIVRFSC